MPGDSGSMPSLCGGAEFSSMGHQHMEAQDKFGWYET